MVLSSKMMKITFQNIHHVSHLNETPVELRGNLDKISLEPVCQYHK